MSLVSAGCYNFYVHRNKIISKFILVAGIALVMYSFLPYVIQDIRYAFLQLRHRKYVLNDKNTVEKESVFAQWLGPQDIKLTPVNKDFSLIIEKIGVNAPVVIGVSVTNEDKYKEALKLGIAHAIVSDLPSEEPGNVYLFSHTSFNFWSLGKYATTFNLLRKLEIGDEANIYYRGKRYIYEVVNKEVLPGWNTYPLTRSVIEPILTLQTCDPPGTTLNRLVVTAKLKEVIESQ
jgi:LPXTG-site transpeptidase (sortase) family protein